MKKVFAVLAITGMFAVVACGPKAEEAATEVEATTEEVVAETEEAIDEAVEATEAVVDSAAAAVEGAVEGAQYSFFTVKQKARCESSGLFV
jgi:hypothetical protein